MQKRLRLMFVMLIFGFANSAQGQTASTADTLKTYKAHWEPYKTFLRIGVGSEGPAYVEMGIARQSYRFDNGWLAAKGSYLDVSWYPKTMRTSDRNIFCMKYGYEINTFWFCLGAESKFITDGTRNELATTPKIGLGFSSSFNFFYGFNIPLIGNKFPELSHNQISLVINIDRHPPR